MLNFHWSLHKIAHQVDTLEMSLIDHIGSTTVCKSPHYDPSRIELDVDQITNPTTMLGSCWIAPSPTSACGSLGFTLSIPCRPRTHPLWWWKRSPRLAQVPNVLGVFLLCAIWLLCMNRLRAPDRMNSSMISRTLEQSLMLCPTF